MAKKEVQKAFVYSFEESAKTLFENYLDNIEAFCNWTKIRDPLTDEEMDPDERLMRSIEEQIGVSENAKKAFREEIMIRISAYSRKGKSSSITIMSAFGKRLRRSCSRTSRTSSKLRPRPKRRMPCS